MGYAFLEFFVAINEVFCHIEEEEGYVIEVEIEVFTEADAVFEDCDIVPLHALERTVEIEALKFFFVRLASYIGFE